MLLKAPAFIRKIHYFIEFEEHVGKFWHHLISGTHIKHYLDEQVHLDDVRQLVSILFRALAGDGGLKIEAAPAQEYHLNRTVMQRIAGINFKFELAWRSDLVLNLPSIIDVFPKKSLNHDLYLWLAAVGAYADPNTNFHHSKLNWVSRNQLLCHQLLKRFPGLAQRYQRLVIAQLELRVDMNTLNEQQKSIELLIRQALNNPHQPVITAAITEIELQQYFIQPIYLWLYQAPKQFSAKQLDNNIENYNCDETTGELVEAKQQRRYRAEQVEMPDGKTGLVLDRFENIFSWAEYIKVDRTTDENEDLSSAEDSANDLEQLSIARDNKAAAKRIRFDLDLPSSEHDDTILKEGILLPEWDYRKKQLINDQCSLVEMIASHSTAMELPQSLRSTAKKLRNQFETLRPSRIWYRAQQQGSEIDLNSYLDFITEQKQNGTTKAVIVEQGLYREFRGANRDMACLVLADLSLSTDSWLGDRARVIDVIRDSLLLFAEALTASGDQFSMYGFSSRNREHIRFHCLKKFDELHSALSRARINAIKPGFYTRMGAAIRYASEILSKQTASQQLLLILTDGKPNDLDLYDGRYGIEDTRMALIEARRKGLQPFCVTIDKKAGDYLPYMFGSENYVVIRKPSELPRELPLLYAQLSR